MKCAEIESQLNFLADGETEFIQKSEIENHLRACRSCRIYFEQLQATARLLKNHLPISAPPALDEKVLRAFKSHHSTAAPQTEKQRFWQKIFISAPVFAAALLIFALAVGAAYQFGKMSVVKSAAANETAVQTLPEKISEPVQPAAAPPIKYVETPVTKIVRIPVVRERKVTRIVYRNNSPAKTFSGGELENSQVAASGKNSSIDLKGFLPVSEIKFRIIKEKNQ